jgi:tetratricopeptide (TPR) repeat protein
MLRGDAFDRLHRLMNPADPGADDPAMPQDAYEAAKQGTFGKFVLLEELGRGGTAVVRRAWQTDLRREVALKMVPWPHPELRERLLREARTGARLTHPALLPVYEAGETDGTVWISMRLVKGRSLEKAQLGPAEAARATGAVARAAHTAHEADVLHRDIKPSNVLQEGTEVFLADLGLARELESREHLTADGEMLGTPGFMAPEQLLGGSLDRRTDVYGLGATLYFFLTARPPFQAARFSELLHLVQNAAVDPPSRARPVARDLETIVMKAIESDPGRRYPTAAAMADDLERFLRGEPVEARPLPWPVRLVRATRRRSQALVLGVAVVALAAGLGLAWRQHRRDAEARDRRDAQAVFRSAEKFRREGAFQPAILEYTRAIDLDPGSADAWSGRGVARMGLERWAEAASDLDHALELDSRRPADHHRRATCSMWLGDIARAVRGFTDALEIDPGNTDTRTHRAAARLKSGDIVGALMDADSTLSRDPTSAWALSIRGEAHMRLGRPEEAVRDFEASLAIRRGPVPLYLRGKIRREKGDYSGALADFAEVRGFGGSWPKHADEEEAVVRRLLTPPE